MGTSSMRAKRVASTPYCLQSGLTLQSAYEIASDNASSASAS